MKPFHDHFPDRSIADCDGYFIRFVGKIAALANHRIFAAEFYILIIIKKNGSAYGIGLDACANCGDAGYYEKDGKIICKRCGVAINLATIGFSGGCNPIPFEYTAADGAITIQTSTLDALSSNFR